MDLGASIFANFSIRPRFHCLTSALNLTNRTSIQLMPETFELWPILGRLEDHQQFHGFKATIHRDSFLFLLFPEKTWGVQSIKRQ